MATLYVTEIDDTGTDINNRPGPAATLPATAEQTVAIGASSTQSAAFNASTRLIRVTTDASCHIVVGTNPTATTSSLRVATDGVEYFYVTPAHKIAVIAAA